MVATAPVLPSLSRRGVLILIPHFALQVHRIFLGKTQEQLFGKRASVLSHVKSEGRTEAICLQLEREQADTVAFETIEEGHMRIRVLKHNAHRRKTDDRVSGGSKTKAVCEVDLETGSRVLVYGMRSILFLFML